MPGDAPIGGEPQLVLRQREKLGFLNGGFRGQVLGIRETSGQLSAVILLAILREVSKQLRSFIGQILRSGSA
jgi:hypothetical protein